MESPSDARGLLRSWDRWVSELERHALDRFEYDELLATRDRLAAELVVAGKERLWDEADEIDAAFLAITVDALGETGGEDDAAWWRQRLPKSEDFRRYLAGDF